MRTERSKEKRGYKQDCDLILKAITVGKAKLLYTDLIEKMPIPVIVNPAILRPPKKQCVVRLVIF